jgi:signal transduction histidine kinase
LWNALATHANTALRLKHLIDRERSDASEQERQRIARELHDSVAQALYGISLGTRSALEQLETNPQNAKQALMYAIDLADGGTSEMKTLLFALRPDALEEGGLAAALHKLCEMLKSRYKLESMITAPLEPNVTLEVKGALYRIAQEAVHNTVKHAKAKLVSIKLENHLLEVSDNGQGFDLNATRAGALGLKSMRERAESLDANFEITSSSTGTRILVKFGGKV